MKTFIPSARRYNEVASGPLRQVPRQMQRDFFYVVSHEEAEYYAKRLVLAGYDLTPVLSYPSPGGLDIAHKRKWIGEFCAENGFDKFGMLDDDIFFVRRISSDGVGLKPSDENDVMWMLQAVHDALDEDAHVGVSLRQGNNNLGLGGPLELRDRNVRTNRALFYRTKEFNEMIHCRLEVMEDFDINLQLLEAGYSNSVLGYWSQDQNKTNAPGGCSTYRTHDLHERSARKLMELHPGIVSLRLKQNKTDKSGFGTRTEVTIQWKKAYQIGQSRVGRT